VGVIIYLNHPNQSPMSSAATKDTPVWQISIEVPKCLDEPVTELLSALLEQPASAYCPL